MNENAESPVRAVGRMLLELARSEDDVAAEIAAGAPYWAPCPSSAATHRAVAVVLRAKAAALQVSVVRSARDRRRT